MSWRRVFPPSHNKKRTTTPKRSNFSAFPALYVSSCRLSAVEPASLQLPSACPALISQQAAVPSCCVGASQTGFPPFSVSPCTCAQEKAPLSVTPSPRRADVPARLSEAAWPRSAVAMNQDEVQTSCNELHRGSRAKKEKKNLPPPPLFHKN